MLGGLTRLLLLLLVVGVILYDGVAIGSARFAVADHGASAADVAGDKWRETSNIQEAFDAAQQSLAGTGEVIDPTTFSINPDNDTVKFRITTTADTLVAKRLPFTRGMTVIVVDVETTSAAPNP